MNAFIWYSGNNAHRSSIHPGQWIVRQYLTYSRSRCMWTFICNTNTHKYYLYVSNISNYTLRENRGE